MKKASNTGCIVKAYEIVHPINFTIEHTNPIPYFTMNRCTKEKVRHLQLQDFIFKYYYFLFECKKYYPGYFFCKNNTPAL